MGENFLVDPKIKDLLNLQEYDVDRLKVETQLRGLPADMQGVRAMIDGIKAEERTLKEEVKQVEVRRKDLDRQLNESEDKVRKFKTQQMEVKKNEEYQAFNVAIERERETIDLLSDQQLELLGDIDELQKKIKEIERDNGEQIRLYEEQVGYLERQEAELKLRCAALQQAVEEASKFVDPVYLKKYYQVEKHVKRGPFVVALEGNRCHGCHLTVSNEVVSEVRHGGAPQQCDNCSRILYVAE